MGGEAEPQGQCVPRPSRGTSVCRPEPGNERENYLVLLHGGDSSGLQGSLGTCPASAQKSMDGEAEPQGQCVPRQSRGTSVRTSMLRFPASALKFRLAIFQIVNAAARKLFRCRLITKGLDGYPAIVADLLECCQNGHEVHLAHPGPHKLGSLA